MIEVNDENFEAELVGKTYIIDFFADFCGPCKKILPILNKVAIETNMPCYKVDTEQYYKVTKKYGVRSIPTVIFIKDGIEINRKVGSATENEYTVLVDQLLAKTE